MKKPQIKELKWLGSTLVEVTVPLLNKAEVEMNIPSDITYDKEIIDLAKLACIRSYYPGDNELQNYHENDLDEDGRSLYETLIDVEGVNTHGICIKKEDLLQAWLYVKSLK